MSCNKNATQIIVAHARLRTSLGWVLTAAAVLCAAEAAVLRDVQKAALAFAGQKVISTGRWGCGVFGGTPAHKFVQQLVAAMLSGSQIHFSTFGTPVSGSRLGCVLLKMAAISSLAGWVRRGPCRAGGDCGSGGRGPCGE